ncbi:MAG: transglycosylase SLT domain-containing protein [Anaerolineales bacterium]|nr:transglycosylase SLT domain-containing protein [Anaerolineales bacterium]
MISESTDYWFDDYEYEEYYLEEDEGPRRLAIQSAVLISIILGFLAFFVIPAAATSAYQGPSRADKPQLQPAVPASSPVCQIDPGFAEKVYRWCDLITRVARSHGLEPNLIAALILQESGGNPVAYSHSGAVGLMQVMPRDGIATKFQCPNGPCFSQRPSIKELEDPTFNVEYGTRMLANLVEKKGSLREALKSYGPMDMGYRYADKVLAIWERHQ